MSSNSNKEAEAFKMKGNEKYRIGAYTEAIDLYNAAVALDPEDPIYLSNLSAAQLEDGRYAPALESCSAVLSLIGTANPGQAALRSKILNRRSKLLTFLHAQDPNLFKDASAACDATLIDNPESSLAISQKNALERRQLAQKIEKKVNQRLTDAPRYRCALKHVMEYYTVGHDDANSIFRVQYTGRDEPSRKHPYAERFHMKVPRDGRLFDFSAMFCGVGDARHVYASFVDIGQDLAERGITGKGKVAPNIRLHFTMNDVNPSALARDLIVLMLLHELSTIPTARHKSDPRALDILLTLHYVYWGTTMPPSAYRTLEKVLNGVSDSVKTAADQGVALDLNWLYIEPSTVKEIDTRLRWWRGAGKTALSFDDILPSRIDSDGRDGLEILQHLHPQDRAALESSNAGRQASMVEFMREDPRARAQCDSEAKKMGITTEKYIELAKSISPQRLARYEHTPPNAYFERDVWEYLRVMIPPPHANEPKSLEKVFRAVRDGKQDGGHIFTTPDILQNAFERIRKRWRANFTLLDKDWLELHAGHIELHHCPFRGTMAMFSEHYRTNLCPTTRKGSIYEWSARFFSLAAEGMTRLHACGANAFRLEVIHGDGYAILEKIKLGTLARNPTFPTRFDRIHTSNVPDYIGGYLASFTTAVPLLKPLPTSYFTNCSLLNSGVWEGGFMNGSHAINLDSALYTYAGVTRAETPAAYGVNIDCTPMFAANYHTFGRINAPTMRLDRGRLAAVAYACFIKTVLPVKYAKHTYPGTIREVLNVHAFFRLMETLKGLGYPPHVLADIIESILENRVGCSPLPHDVVPIALASRARVCALCTTPFQAEFEVAAAMWEPRLFPICSQLVPITDDIVRYSVRFTMTPLPLEESIPPTPFVLMLIFGLPSDLDADIKDLRKRLTGTHKCHTSIQLLSTFDYDHDRRVATFFLSRKRANNFIQAGFEIAVLNTMFWRIQSRKVLCAKMEVVGDLDEWDQKRTILTPKSRPLTAREMVAWENDILHGCYGPTPPISSGNPLMSTLGKMGGTSNGDGERPGVKEMVEKVFGSGEQH